MKRGHSSPFLAVLASALALGCFDQRPPPAQAAGPSSIPAVTHLDSLIAVADSLYRIGSYAEAREAWMSGLQYVRTNRDVAAESRILTSLGLTEWRLGDYDAAQMQTEHARDLLEANGPRLLLPRTYNALGLIAWDQGRMSEAAALWQRTMDIAREVGDQEYVDKPSMNLGLWYAGIGEAERAREAFTSSLAAGRTLGIRALELRSLVNLAMVANQAGNPRLALAWLDSAAAAGVEEDFLAEDNYRSQMAIAAWALGDPGVALAGLDSAVRGAARAGHRQSEAANLTLMADIYWEAGDPARALGLHARAEAIHATLDLPAEQGQNLHSAARIQAVMGHTDRARELASHALRLHQQSEDLVHQLDDRLLLAELGGRDHLTESRVLAGKLSTRAARTRLGLAEARLASQGGRPREVLRALTAIAPDLQDGLSPEVSEAEALRAGAYASLTQWDSAVAAGRRAIAALERMGSGHGSGLLRASFASFRSAIYGQLVTALLALGHTDEAFEVADRARGGAALALAGRGQGPGTTAADTAAEGTLHRLAALEREIRERDEGGLESVELRELLRRAEADYEIAILSAGDEAHDESPLGTRVSQIRRALAQDELMLAYLVTPEQLFVFTLTHEKTSVQVVPIGAAEIEARVRLARQLLADRSAPPADAEPVLAILAQWLLPSPQLEAGQVRRLVLVPHGALAYLPFAALKTSRGDYLVERYALVHLPAASYATRDEPPSSAATSATAKLTALAPLPGDLPATNVEVQAIGRAHPGSRILVGRGASESALRTALGSGAAVHVASHGVLNRLNPLFTRVELFPSRTRSPADDGRLEVHEVLALGIRSPLVFLSGCETGLGPGGSRRYAPGEDYATLAAAFLAAGAGQVVATLWAIPDTGAAVFAARFYADLGRTDAADALVSAQRALLAEGRFRHPYYWAGYRLAGSPSTGRQAAVK